MKLVSRGLLVTLVCSFMASAQKAPAEHVPMAEEVFHNVQVLKGITASQFMETMGFFSASLGENCTFCHVEESGGNWARYADDNAHKRTARRMITMVTAINKGQFGGARMVTCYSCHHGLERPNVTPNLDELYGPPLPNEPDQIRPVDGAPPAAPILEKYLAALGGEAKLKALSSYTATGTYQGFGETETSPFELAAKGAMFASRVHTPNGDVARVWDGKAGWSVAPATDRPVTLLPLSGGEIEAARLDALLAFPAGLREAFTEWRVGFRTAIEKRDAEVVEGRNRGQLPVRFYFDRQSGLLVRVVRYLESPVGLSPTRIDYADYREVAGVKIPFRWTTTWLDGRSTTELSELRPNAPVDAAQFRKPAAPGK